MATVGACHDLQDDARLAMPARSKNDAVISPFHGATIYLMRPEVQSGNDGFPKRNFAGAKVCNFR